MNKLGWILGLTCLGVTAYVFLSEASSERVQTAGGYDDADEFGERAGNWGTKQRVKGTGGVLGGKLKQGFGKVTGVNQTEAEGLVDEGVGRVKDAAGQVAHAVSDAIADRS
jgi:uncharacterized protein YjbJ (UPF0337 family)